MVKPRGGIATLLPFALRQWPALTVIVGLTLASAAVAALQPWPLKLLVDHALRQDPLPAALSPWLARFPIDTGSRPQLMVLAAVGAIAISAAGALIDAALNLAWAWGGQRMVYDLAGTLFSRLQRLSLSFHNRRPVGDSLSRLTTDTWCVYSMTSSLMVSPIQQISTLAGIGAVAWSLDPELSLISFAMAPLLGASSVYFGRKMKSRTHGSREAQTRLLSFVQQVMASISLVQIFGVEARNRQRFLDLAEDAVDWARRGALIGSSYGLANGLITTSGMALILYFGGHRVLSGALSLGGLLVFLAYMRTLQSAAGGLLRIYGNYKPLEAGVERVSEILEVRDLIHDEPGAIVLPPRGDRRRGHVVIDDVSFAYEPGRPVLEDVALEVHAGETIALVGATGAGKSTLVSLLPRFFDPQRGRVLLDGTDIRRIRLASLRSQISIVLQEPFLLPMTVAENISYVRRGATREEIVRAAVAANADEFIRELPQGYDSPVGERGATLSGGQRQRLAIARALLRDSPLLILDEPTSALDVHSEALLLDALKRLMAGRTTFLIAHRLSTIRDARRIAVLDRGRIVECGSHVELLAARGAYRRFHEIQFGSVAEGAA